MEIVIHPILTDADVDKASKRIEEIWDAEEGTPEYYELDILTLLVSEYERKQYPLTEANPIEMITYRMEQMGLSRADLAKLAFNGHRGRVTDILDGKRKLNLSMVRTLSEVLKVDPKFLIKEY
ncbi:MAG: hypothetical protein R8P61_28180 [Bacteroidia bacterium]|nr:hypothetical protein [Bacteroidia bacterium]